MSNNMMTINQMYRMLHVWTHRIRHSDRFIERYSGSQRALLAYLSLDLLMEDDGFVLLIADGRGKHALAPETADGIMVLLNQINRTGTTIVMSTHNARAVNDMRRRVIELKLGNLVRDDAHGVYGEA